MFDLTSYLTGLLVLAMAGLLVWPLSVYKENAGIVDSLWSVFFILAAVTYFMTVPETGPRSGFMLALVGVWGFRLSAHITWRNWGEGEDHRYRAMRKRNEPFAWKSLYLVFLLQAVIAWVVSLPLLGAISGQAAIGILDIAGFLIFTLGLFFEALGDWQLARFKADPANQGKVLDTGLWRYTRHPNYFGDFCVWWGFGLIALSAGAWWSLPAPLIMTGLLLKVSGVSLLEKDISERRPEYTEYILRTNAFFPGPRKQVKASNPSS